MKEVCRKAEAADLQPVYEAPKVEAEIAPEDLEREVLYAGGITRTV